MTGQDTRIPLANGTHLKNSEYVIVRALPLSGGFSIVYLAQRTDELARDVAIKEFCPVGCLRSENVIVPANSWERENKFALWMAKFQDEAKRLRDLNHPAIVQVESLFNENGTSYMVMPFITGETFSALDIPLDIDAAFRMILSLLEPVEHLHSLPSPIFHQDIKPDNAKLLPDGRVMLLDFGAARSYLPDDITSKTTIHSDGFAAPEQYLKHEARGPYTDIYGITATLFYLMTGKPPMNAPTRRLLVAEKKADPFLEQIEYWKEAVVIPEPLVTAITTGLAVYAEDRPQTVAIFRTMLQQYLITSPPLPTLPRVRFPETIRPVTSAEKENALLLQVINFAHSIQNCVNRVQALANIASACATIAPQKMDNLFQVALGIAQNIPLSRDRYEALVTVSAALARTDPQKALEIAQGIQNSSWKANAMHSFVSAYARTNPQKALDVAQDIEDDEIKANALVNIGSVWTGNDPQRAAFVFQQALDVTPGIKGDYERDLVLAKVASAWTQVDAQKAQDIAQRINYNDFKIKALSVVAHVWSRTNPHQAKSQIQEVMDIARCARNDTERIGLLATIASCLTKIDPDKALDIAQSIPGGPNKARALSAVASCWAETDPQKALDLAQSIEDDEIKAKALVNVAKALIGATSDEEGESGE